MEKVTKVCLQITMAELFISLFPHAKLACYRLNEKTVPQIGYLYAFLNEKEAINWIHKVIETEEFNPVVEQIKSHGAKLRLLQGDTTRIVCKFSAAIRHITSNQLMNPELANAFWNIGTGSVNKQLTLLPDPSGSVLIPDFTPRFVSTELN